MHMSSRPRRRRNAAFPHIAPARQPQRTTIGPLTPGNGKPSASASTAARAARESRCQGCTVSAAPARRHVPTISPSTRTAPGHTREVQSWARRSGCGTTSSRSAPWSRKYASPLGRSRAAAAGPEIGAPARRASVSRRRRSVFAPGSASVVALRTPPCRPPVRSPPTGRTTPASWGRRRAGIGVRAPDELHAVRSRVSGPSRPQVL